MKLKQEPVGIGQNLKRLRLQAGYSQSRLVKQLQEMGITITTDIYKKMEQNRYNIRIIELMALREIYGISYDEFFGGLFFDCPQKEQS